MLYPTGLYTSLSREGTGGIIPHDTYVPHILSVSHEALLTWHAHARVWVTPKVAFTTALRSGRSSLPSIDLPVVFPRMAAHRKGWSAHFGVDLDAQLTDRLVLSADVDAFLLPTPLARYAFEHAAMLSWRVSTAVRISLGYKLVYGAYPFGTSWNLGDAPWPLPLFDVRWRWE